MFYGVLGGIHLWAPTLWNTVMNEPAVYTVKQFGARFAVSRTRFYRLIQEGQLSPVKIGRRTVVTTTEAQRWLSSLPPQRKQNQQQSSAVQRVANSSCKGAPL